MKKEKINCDSCGNDVFFLFRLYFENWRLNSNKRKEKNEKMKKRKKKIKLTTKLTGSYLRTCTLMVSPIKMPIHLLMLRNHVKTDHFEWKILVELVNLKCFSFWIILRFLSLTFIVRFFFHK